MNNYANESKYPIFKLYNILQQKKTRESVGFMTCVNDYRQKQNIFS